MRLVLCDDHRILVESLAVALQARGYDVRAATTTQNKYNQKKIKNNVIKKF